MKIEIKVISLDIIRPSSQTPNDLSNYKLSILDQMIGPPVLMPRVFFYESSGTNLTNSERSNRLKKSLSKTLSIYYPLAGRLIDNSYVNCNDEGIMYAEALANSKLLDVINETNDTKELDKFLPRNLNDVTDHCIMIQVTFFNCGGLAIGIAVSHKLADAWSYFMFVNSWAAISRGDDAQIRSPVLKGATLFPPKDLGGFISRFETMDKEDIITKKFMFTAIKINELKGIYTNTLRATRVEAISAFIWTRFMHSTQEKESNYVPKKVFSLNHLVNIRKRVVPPLSDELFGNMLTLAISMPSLSDDICQIVEKMRESVRIIGGDYVNKLNLYLNSIEDKGEKVFSSEMEHFVFTSLCRFPIYEVDFGWGKPVWIIPGTGHFKNLVTLMDSNNGGGIEAWVNLGSEDMAKFEADEELLAYATM